MIWLDGWIVIDLDKWISTYVGGYPLMWMDKWMDDR